MIIRNYSGEMANLMESYYLCVSCSLKFLIDTSPWMKWDARHAYLLHGKEQFLLCAKQVMMI